MNRFVPLCQTINPCWDQWELSVATFLLSIEKFQISLLVYVLKMILTLHLSLGTKAFHALCQRTFSNMKRLTFFFFPLS